MESEQQRAKPNKTKKEKETKNKYSKKATGQTDHNKPP